MKLERTEGLNNIAFYVTQMISTCGRRDDILVTFYRADTESELAKFTDFQKRYYGIRTGEEYFLIYEKGHQLLYVVNVTADSLLTAASELLDLASRKGL